MIIAEKLRSYFKNSNVLAEIDAIVQYWFEYQGNQFDLFTLNSSYSGSNSWIYIEW